MINFGRYQVINELKRGGMATIYHAYDPIFERDVAIKVLPSVFLHDPSFRTRFDREAKTIASLEHPAIVPVYDFGEQDNLPYIVMRYMTGGSLAERLIEGPLSLSDTISILSRLAPAMDAAHARGIIHRDIKPGNILFDQYGNAFLSDFGIARLAQQSTATITGESIIGTPTYMSPEQIQGEKTIDGRSDIYSLGILVYQMLAGEAPYRSETPTKLMMMHLLEPVPKITDTIPSVPLACENVLGKALEKNPNNRYSTIGEFFSNLENAYRSSIHSEKFSDHSQILQDNQPNKQKTKPQQIPNTVISNIQSQHTKPHYKRQQQIRKFSNFLLPGTIIIIITIVSLITISTVTLLTNTSLLKLNKISNVQSQEVQEPSSNVMKTNSEFLRITSATSEIQITPSHIVLPTNTIIPSVTSYFSPTYTSVPTLPSIGNADKLAYLRDNDIWITNLDGSDAIQLTEDHTEKNQLRWTLDGKSIQYILGKCIQTIDIDTGRIDTITCFNFIDYLRAFEISPDNKKVAISLDNQLYIVPNDLQKLSNARTRNDLIEMAECKELAPFEKNFIKQVRWSKDSQLISAIVIGVNDSGLRADWIRVFDVSKCTKDPPILDHFPSSSRLPIKDYDKNPTLQNFGWDGQYLFALNNVIRNGGFGDLYIYNMELHKGRIAINPIDGNCCYRDPQWSPDGDYLLFTFQNMKEGSKAITQFYFVLYGTIGTGMHYTPLPIPAFKDIRANPQPVLRTLYSTP